MAGSIRMQRGCVYLMDDGRKFFFLTEVGKLLGGICLETGKNRYLKPEARAVSLVEDRRISIRKSYLTRSGLPVKIQETDILGDYCVLASIPTNGKWRMWTFLIDGKQYRDQDSPLDLVEYKQIDYARGELVDVWEQSLKWGLGSIQARVPGYSDRYYVVLLQEHEFVKGIVPRPSTAPTLEVQGNLLRKIPAERQEYLMSGLQDMYQKAIKMPVES